MQVTAETKLPVLRDELVFLEGAEDGEGAKGFLIFDPVRHLYFRIGLDAARAFGAWGAGTAGALVNKLRQQKVFIDLDDVAALIKFVSANSLSLAVAKALIEQNQQSERSLFTRALHGYLFFKIPLFRPQKFLDLFYPYVRFLGTRWSIITIGILTLFGIFLSARQFDVFLHSFSGFNSLNGAILLIIALVLLKSAHELGHAFVATAYKCRVPVIGVAFMVMVPMLYSDVSDAWRLKQRRKRLMIDGAGMMVEIAIGGIALLLWALLLPGPLRSLCLFLATTSWIMSLLVNLSPFMRFDGYHILADFLGIHNLQARGFAIGRWQMRKWLFGLGDDVPEQFNSRLHNLLVAYAWGTWIYRFFLFLGIALVVYFMFFKLLGIMLLVFELVWFIGMPIMKELKFWWKRRLDILSSRRGLISLCLFAGLALMLFLPLSQTISTPGLLTSSEQYQSYAPGPGQVESVYVKIGDEVSKGQVLARLRSLEIASERQRAQLRLELVNIRLARGVSDDRERALRAVFAKERSSLVNQLSGLNARLDALVLRAPGDGFVSDVANGLAPGMWVSQDQRLFHIVGKYTKYQVQGLVEETLINRIKVGESGVFISENPTQAKTSVRVSKIGIGNSAGRELLYLASVNNGGVASERLPNGQLRTTRSVFPIVLDLTRQDNTKPAFVTGWQHEQRGSVVIQAKAQSIAERFFSYGFSVLIRETGF